LTAGRRSRSTKGSTDGSVRIENSKGVRGAKSRVEVGIRDEPIVMSPPADTETPVYLITQVTASEPERLRPYLARIVPLIERHDWEVLDIVRAAEILEGSSVRGR
jgi:hypothetical protein